nr:MAG TPA: hypothetical protein [Caudoviricetes sp.]DAT90965.1 MAG TPA: hypothetical protein [Caudoviricetes sp.]
MITFRNNKFQIIVQSCQIRLTVGEDRSVVI